MKDPVDPSIGAVPSDAAGVCAASGFDGDGVVVHLVFSLVEFPVFVDVTGVKASTVLGPTSVEVEAFGVEVEDHGVVSVGCKRVVPCDLGGKPKAAVVVGDDVGGLDNANVGRGFGGPWEENVKGDSESVARRHAVAHVKILAKVLPVVSVPTVGQRAGYVFGREDAHVEGGALKTHGGV